MKFNVVKEKISELVALIERKEDAALQFNAACDAVASDADCDVSALKKAVVARYKDKMKELKEKTEHALDVFEASEI